jgi:hypothetical protein
VSQFNEIAFFNPSRSHAMRQLLVAGLVGCAVLVFAFAGTETRRTAAADAKEPQIVHSVYFSLKDSSPAARAKLVAACKKYLTKHPGEVYFSAGTLAEDLKRPVNDRDFDVSLNIVFQDQKSHDQYQDAPRHKQFIDENKDGWKKVRVFDSVVQP